MQIKDYSAPIKIERARTALRARDGDELPQLWERRRIRKRHHHTELRGDHGDIQSSTTKENQWETSFGTGTSKRERSNLPSYFSTLKYAQKFALETPRLTHARFTHATQLIAHPLDPPADRVEHQKKPTRSTRLGTSPVSKHAAPNCPGDTCNSSGPVISSEASV
jgi:hypothetical protein